MVQNIGDQTTVRPNPNYYRDLDSQAHYNDKMMMKLPVLVCAEENNKP